MTTPEASGFIRQPTAKMVARPQTTTETQTPSQQEGAFPATTAQPPKHRGQQPVITDMPMASAPSTQIARAPLPLPTVKRDVADDLAEGSASKQQMASTRQTAPARPQTTLEESLTTTKDHSRDCDNKERTGDQSSAQQG